MLQFSIVQGSLKITNGTSTILLIAKKDITVNALSLQEAIPKVELYNIQLGYTGVVFLQPLSDCEDDLGNPFTVNSFIAFAENNFGFTTGGGGGGTVTSVGLTMPSAFNVSNSPITTSGDIAVTGAGLVSQYVRGDGTLASFPDVAGGGGGQVYYFNGGISQGTIAGDAFYQMSVAANLAAGVDFTSTTVENNLFANFITDIGKPTQETIPAGVWIFQCYLSQSLTTGTPSVYATVEIYDGVTFTVLSTSLDENITNGTSIDLYTFTCAVPEYTPLTTTDRVVVRFYAENLSGTSTITLHTQGVHLSSVQTTFTTGISALDGLTATAQYFQTGTTGTDFNITTLGTDIHVFNLPTATALIRGALSSADWTIFNGKQNALGFTPADSALTISTTAPLSGGGNLTANRTLTIAQSNTTTDGYLSSIDWNVFNGKQDLLVSTVNIKSINGTSILGAGNITIAGGTALIPYNAYLDTVSGNDATGTLEDPTKPYLTMAALIAALPAAYTLAWTINIIGATTAITMPVMPPRDLIFNADARYTYDFNFNTGSGYIITTTTKFFTYTFLNGNINLKSDAVANRSLGTAISTNSFLIIKGQINIIDWSNEGVSGSGVILLNSDLIINEVVKRTSGFAVFIGNPISLRIKKITFVAFPLTGVLRSSSTYITNPVIIEYIFCSFTSDVELTANAALPNLTLELKLIQVTGRFLISYAPTRLVFNELTCTGGVTNLTTTASVTTGRIVTATPLIFTKVASSTLQNLECTISGSNNNWASTVTIDNCRLSVTDYIVRNAIASAKVVIFRGNNIITALSASPVIVALNSTTPYSLDIQGTLNLTNGSSLTDQFSTINYIANAIPSYNGLATAIQSMNILT